MAALQKDYLKKKYFHHEHFIKNVSKIYESLVPAKRLWSAIKALAKQQSFSSQVIIR